MYISCDRINQLFAYSIEKVEIAPLQRTLSYFNALVVVPKYIQAVKLLQ